jgi:hypothetical protein
MYDTEPAPVQLSMRCGASAFLAPEGAGALLAAICCPQGTANKHVKQMLRALVLLQA